LRYQVILAPFTPAALALEWTILAPSSTDVGSGERSALAEERRGERGLARRRNDNTVLTLTQEPE
jgi:hypothetical protein